MILYFIVVSFAMFVSQSGGGAGRFPHGLPL
jgi:hypothetical protein